MGKRCPDCVRQRMQHRRFQPVSKFGNLMPGWPRHRRRQQVFPKQLRDLVKLPGQTLRLRTLHQLNLCAMSHTNAICYVRHSKERVLTGIATY